MSLDKLPFNFFDLTLVAVIIIGVLRGRKHGMSEELLSLLKWLAVIVGCALLYEPAGHLVAQTSPFSLLSSFLIVYISVGLLILGVFALLKRSLGGKLLGSDFFGGAEYYLGMGSGVVRFTCILMALLALLNARYPHPQEVKANERYQSEVYGSNFFPGLQNVQALVFEKSLAGPWIRQNLNFLLIKPTAPENKDMHQKEYQPPEIGAAHSRRGNLGLRSESPPSGLPFHGGYILLSMFMAGFFSTATLEQIRAASDIVDVIGACLPLKRAGANFVALCPFHKEKSPSFNVNPTRQTFYCFGCHKGGDVFTFVKEYENLDFPDAVRRLAERARIPLEFQNASGDAHTRDLKDTLLQIHEQITQRWQNALSNEAAGQIARDYLANRQVSGEAVKLFRLGYAPDLWDDTVNWAKSKGYPLEVVEKSGLILRKEGADHYYDRFRGRLMFPICDEQGRVVGFSGRVLSGDAKRAKYVNSPETPIFTKSKVFFGLDKSKRELLQAGHAVVCEGQLDLIAAYMGGVQNVVAPQGTALTADHARILKRYVEEVVLCFDSDEAGQNAAVRSLDSLLACGLAVRVAVVPTPHDPDSFIKASGGAAFKQLIENAEGFFDYYLNRLCATNEVYSDKGRLAVLRGMSEAVHKTGNVVLVDTYARKTALRLGVSPEAVRAEFRKLSRVVGVKPALAPGETPEAKPPPRPHVTEHWLLKLLLLDDDLVHWAVEHLDPDWVRHPLARQIVAKRIEACKTGTWVSLAAFLDECTEAGLQALITEVAAHGQPIPAPARQLADVVLKLRNQHLDRELAVLMQQMNHPQTSEEQRLELLHRQQELRAMKRAAL